MSSDLQGAVGQSVLRREDDYLLRGQGRFVDDLPTPLNTLHLAFVLSPYAHARIASIDASEALALDGVVDVFTGALYHAVDPAGEFSLGPCNGHRLAAQFHPAQQHVPYTHQPAA